MKKTVDELSLKELNNFPALMEAVMKYLDQYWDMKAKPKGYDEYLKTYEEYDTEDCEYEFDGPIYISASCDEFPERLSKSSVAYGDTQQGRTPIYALIGAVFAYGLDIGAHREKLNEDNIMLLNNARKVLADLKNDRLPLDRLKEWAEYTIEDIDRKFPQLKKP